MPPPAAARPNIIMNSYALVVRHVILTLIMTVSNMNTSHYAVAQGLLPKGAYISEVEPGSPAEQAGIQVADIVVEIDGTIISNTTQMTSYLQSKQAGDVVKMKIYRVDGGLNNVEGNDIPDGEYIDLEVTLAVLDEVQQ